MFAVVAIVSLAVGIGGSTAVFAAVKGVLLEPLPFSNPERLAFIRWSSGSRVSPRHLDAWRGDTATFADIAGWYDARANLTGDGAPAELAVDRVTPNFFALLGTPAVL